MSNGSEQATSGHFLSVIAVAVKVSASSTCFATKHIGNNPLPPPLLTVPTQFVLSALLRTFNKASSVQPLVCGEVSREKVGWGEGVFNKSVAESKH